MAGGLNAAESYRIITSVAHRPQSERRKDVMHQVPTIAAVVACSLAFFASSAVGQALTPTPSEWLEKLDREHNQLVSPAGHVHARGQVRAVEPGPGGTSVTLLVEPMESSDGSIRMQAMEMPFHVTNRRMLKGLQPGDAVEFEATRLKNDVMVTNIRKAR
jgi:Cu/Ag efflux protein CusF